MSAWSLCLVQCFLTLKWQNSNWWLKTKSATVNKSPFYLIGFDESLNHMLQDKQMDIHARFWDSENSQAETRFLTSMFLEKATPEDLQQELLHGIINLDPKKASMLSMDGPNVNWLVLQLLNEHWKLNELAKLIPTGLSYYFSFRNKLDIVFINSWAGLVICILQVNCGSHIWFSVFLALQFPPIMAVLMFYFDFLQVFAPFMWFMVEN